MRPFLKNTEEIIKKLLKPKQSCLFLLLISSLVSFSGCVRPTYPSAKVIQSVKKLCKDEYNLNVEAKVTGTTLGVSIPIEELVDEELKLAKEAADKIEHVALSMRRVVLSTDRPIDFYIVCARDTEMVGAEYVMTSYVMDIKRARFLDISRNEYLNRIQRDFRLNPQVLGIDKVKRLFAELNQEVEPLIVLAKYASFSLSAQQIQGIFYPTILLAQPQSINYQIIDIKSKEISDQEALVWVKVKEKYIPKPEAKKGIAIFPPGFTNQYLFRLNSSDFSKVIAEVVPQFFQQENTIRQRNLAQIFAQYEDIAVLDVNGLPIKQIDTMNFLAKQIAKRLRERLEHEESFKERFQVNSIVAAFEEGRFKLYFDVEGEQEELFTEALSLIGNITHSYWLKDFAGAELIVPKTNATIKVNKQQLEQLRLKQITIEHFL